MDNTARIWDLRRHGKCTYTLPAHGNLVSCVRYQRTDGDYLLTASYDATIKVWAMPSCAPLKTLVGHEGKILAADCSADGKLVVSASWDRTFKLWRSE